ncbi:MAG: hypothetical protein R3F07_01520 [Opitutaceae bacterium]
MISSFLRFALPIFVLLMGRNVADAGIAEDLVVLHLDAIGGRAVVDDLKAVHKKGYNQFGERRIPIEIWSAYPDLIRIETRLSETTTLIQGFNGHEAWQVRVVDGQVRPESMSPDEERQFVDEAWFRGPLVDAELRGFELDYSGISTIGQDRGFLIRVNRNGELWCEVLLADDTYQIAAKRLEPVIRGRKVKVLQQYSDFQPVAGVWLPHRVEMVQDEHLSVITVYESMDGNPELGEGFFEAPGKR